MEMKADGGRWPMESIDPPGKYKIAYAPGHLENTCTLTGSYSATPGRPSTGEIIIVERCIPLTNHAAKVDAKNKIVAFFDDHWLRVSGAK